MYSTGLDSCRLVDCKQIRVYRMSLVRVRVGVGVRVTYARLVWNLLRFYAKLT